MSGGGGVEQWAGQLGDGRAINLGEAVGPDGRRWELQLKVLIAQILARSFILTLCTQRLENSYLPQRSFYVCACVSMCLRAWSRDLVQGGPRPLNAMF